MTVSDPLTLDEAKRAAGAEVEAARVTLIDLSHGIHALAEVAWEEHESAALVARTMRDAGFTVTEGAHGVPTAVEAVYGSGDLVVAICAEYDALPEVGHGCGHNMIAAAGVGGALALAPLADAAGLRIKLLGTPAEEHGGGKVPMLLGGAWEDADLSLMVHGTTGNDTSASTQAFTAAERFEVVFRGKEAHAAGYAADALNAGAAATLALTALALLRQHIPPRTSMNAFISKAGDVTNIIPGVAVLQAEVRAADVDTWRALKKRALACFEGAAIATGCTFETRQTENPYAPFVPDAALAAAWDRNLVEIGREIKTLENGSNGGSSDMGNVSQVVPSIHPMLSFLGESAPAHNAAFTKAAVTPAADQAMIDGATLIARTVLEIALTPELRADFQERRRRRPEGATRVTLEA